MGVYGGFMGVLWGFLKELERLTVNCHKILNFWWESMKILGIVQVFERFYGVVWGAEKWGFFEGKSREFEEMRGFLGGGKKGVIGVSKS